MWECPFFVNVTSQSDAAASSPADTFMLCVSPYPHHLKDRPTNPCLYWLGPLQNGRFSLEDAHGAPLPWTFKTLYLLGHQSLPPSPSNHSHLHRLSP